MTINKWAAILTLAAGVAGGATSASAVTFDFTSCHITAGCGTLPYGTVSLTQDATTPANLDVTVTLSDSNTFAQTGAGSQVLFAFNGTGVALSDIHDVTGNNIPAGNSVVAVGSPPGPFTGPGGAPDFGSFNFAIQCQPSGPFCNGATAITTISFIVNNASIADLSTPNSTGTIFIADVLIGNVTGTPTGVVDVSVPGPVVGAGLPGLLAACGGLVMLGRRRRQKVA